MTDQTLSFRIDGVQPEEACLVTPPKAFARSFKQLATTAIPGHAQLGEHGLAMHWLERAHRERNVQVVSLKVDRGALIRATIEEQLRAAPGHSNSKPKTA